jgi:hypothetical protein
MSVKENPCGVTAVVSGREKQLLIEAARKLDVPYYTLIRRLVRYILDGKIEWMELFKLSNELTAEDRPEDGDKKFIRTQLSPELSSAFSRLADDWGSNTGIILRRLMLLYISGKIPREAIWY